MFSRDAEGSPEYRLLCAIVARATRDILEPGRWMRVQKQSEMVQNYLSALDWMFSDEYQWRAMRENICALLDLDVSCLQARMLELMKHDMAKKTHDRLCAVDAQTQKEIDARWPILAGTN